jgi:lipoic acid synthetase
MADKLMANHESNTHFAMQNECPFRKRNVHTTKYGSLNTKPPSTTDLHKSCKTLAVCYKQKKPPWLKIKLAYNANTAKISDLVASKKLKSVCQSAHCPNRSECWANGTATFMIMGEYCTRACRFCAVKTIAKPPPLDEDEPKNLADAIAELRLKYVVITSVTRDDLQDYGSGHFANCVRAIKEKTPDVLVEVLVPDFCANDEAIKHVVDAEPDVIGHNIETVKRLTPAIRDRRASYLQSLLTLKKFKQRTKEKNKKIKTNFRENLSALEFTNSNIITKSGMMVGLGETTAEVEKTLCDLLKAGVEIVTIGQYLQPSKGKRHVEVDEYITPEKFGEYEKLAYSLGFKYVASGPLVRSSYRAAEGFAKAIAQIY